MYRLPAELTLDVLKQYASYLFSRISESKNLTFKEVKIDGQLPLSKNCHENARLFVESNPTYKTIFGWLCIDGGIISPGVIFLAHSVIQDAAGNIYEITPIKSTEPRSFLSSELDENDFADIVNELERISGAGTLFHSK